MIDEIARQSVDRARWNDGRWVTPLHGSYCFTTIPHLIEALFTAGPPDPIRTTLLGPAGAAPYDAVVLFFIDAFGWRFYEPHADASPLLKRVRDDGHVTKLTAQFPSTTTAHMTTINTGLPVGQSGLYEWFQYEPRVDAIVAPLLFSFASDSNRDTLVRAGLSPSDLYPRTTLYQRLAAAGVTSYIFADAVYTPSPFDEITSSSASLRPFATFEAGLQDLAALLKAGRGKGRAYYFFYMDEIDAESHQHGPESSEVAEAIERCFTLLQGVFDNMVSAGLHDTLLLMTADHGQITVDPAATIYLDQTLPALKDWIKTNAKGDLLVPAGSSRDLFLHIRPEHMDEAQRTLQQHLEGKALIQRVDDLVTRGFFGLPSDTFLSRVGDLVVLPEPGQMIWWLGDGRYRQHFKGHHGGMTPQEMETLLLSLPF